MIIGVVSDIHGNEVALRAVLPHLKSVEAIWCLGDIVGYGPRPNEVVELIAGLPRCTCVAGNHDWAAIGRLDTTSFNPDAADAALWTSRKLTPVARKYLAGLPVTRVEGDWTLVHGSPSDSLTQYVLDCRDATMSFANLVTNYCLVGHTHVPAFFVSNNQLGDDGSCSEIPVAVGTAISIDNWPAIINPGSVGQPRDGDSNASFLALDTTNGQVTFQRVPYDVEETQSQMQRAGLPEHLWHRLSFGL